MVIKMRECKGVFGYYNKETRKYEEREFIHGLFHQWGNDYEEFEDNAGNYTVAIVELPNGEIITPFPRNIVFTDISKGEEENE